MRDWIPVVTMLAALLGGCASHNQLAAPVADLLRIGLVNDPRQVSRLEKAMTDKDIARLLDVDVRAKLPSSVAVARLASSCSGYQPRLERIDADELGGWEEAFADQDLITGAHPISHLLTGGGEPTLHALRSAAARMNCELLLVYLQADSSVDNFNDAAVLYWTVLGLWLVPGNEVQHQTVSQGILVDCRTGMILGTATGSRCLKKLCPAAFVDVRRTELGTQAEREALADLQKGVRRLVGRVVARSRRFARQRGAHPLSPESASTTETQRPQSL